MKVELMPQKIILKIKYLIKNIVFVKIILDLFDLKNNFWQSIFLVTVTFYSVIHILSWLNIFSQLSCILAGKLYNDAKLMCDKRIAVGGLK